MTPKDFDAFEDSLNNSEPNQDWTPALKSLWYAAKSDWEASHSIAQDLHTPFGSWIHAHLHRVEGDKFNAQYWYSQAGKRYCNSSFNDEVKEIVTAFLVNFYKVM